MFIVSSSRHRCVLFKFPSDCLLFWNGSDCKQLLYLRDAFVCGFSQFHSARQVLRAPFTDRLSVLSQFFSHKITLCTMSYLELPIQFGGQVNIYPLWITLHKCGSVRLLDPWNRQCAKWIRRWFCDWNVRTAGRSRRSGQSPRSCGTWRTRWAAGWGCARGRGRAACGSRWPPTCCRAAVALLIMPFLLLTTILLRCVGFAYRLTVETRNGPKEVPLYVSVRLRLILYNLF